MGKNLKGKECGKGIYQRKDGLYHARFVDKAGKRHEKYFHGCPPFQSVFFFNLCVCSGCYVDK